MTWILLMLTWHTAISNPHAQRFSWLGCGNRAQLLVPSAGLWGRWRAGDIAHANNWPVSAWTDASGHGRTHHPDPDPDDSGVYPLFKTGPARVAFSGASAALVGVNPPLDGTEFGMQAYALVFRVGADHDGSGDDAMILGFHTTNALGQNQVAIQNVGIYHSPNGNDPNVSFRDYSGVNQALVTRAVALPQEDSDPFSEHPWHLLIGWDQDGDHHMILDGVEHVFADQGSFADFSPAAPPGDIVLGGGITGGITGSEQEASHHTIQPFYGDIRDAVIYAAVGPSAWSVDSIPILHRALARYYGIA